MARYRILYVPDHPLAINDRGQVWEHRAVLWDKVGGGTHPCHYCGKPVQWYLPKTRDERHAVDELTVEHLNRDRSDNRPENLVPSCLGCNVAQGNRVPTVRIQPGERFVIYQGRRHRAEERTCEQCGTDFVARSSEVKIGGGRFCSGSCRASAMNVARYGLDDTNSIVRGGKRMRAVPRVCEHCGTDFLASAGNVKAGQGRFCSMSCARRVTGGRRKKG